MNMLRFTIVPLLFLLQAEPQWVQVSRQTVRESRPVAGTFHARRTTRVGPQVSGRVKKVMARVGDRVKEGQELAQLDPVMTEIEVALRRVDVEQAKTALEDAELNFSRMKGLWEKPEGGEPSIPKKLYDQAKVQRDLALARRDQAAKALSLSEERLRETVIRAPYDGVVTRRFVDEGEPVTSMPVSPILEIQEMGFLELEFALPQELLSAVQAGTPVEFDAEGLGGQVFQARVSVVYPVVEAATRSFRCRAFLDNPEGRLRPGLLARVRVTVREYKDALAVPRRVLAGNGGGWRVKVKGKDKPEERAVKVGHLGEEWAVIESGLSEGDWVLDPERR